MSKSKLESIFLALLVLIISAYYIFFGEGRGVLSKYNSDVEADSEIIVKIDTSSTMAETMAETEVIVKSTAMISEEKPAETSPPEVLTATEPSTGDLININTASIEELTTLKGIGEKKAQAILNYREEYGAFGYKEELMNVSGIGESIFNKVKDYICI